MNDSDDKFVKQQLIDTVQNIKQKYRSLQQQEHDLHQSLNVQYKPLLDPLNIIAENSIETKKVSDRGTAIANPQKDLKNPIVSVERIEHINLGDFLKVLGTNIHDSKYGVNKSDSGSYFIGKTQITLNSKQMFINDDSFHLSIGLMNLLFLKRPNYYTDADLAHYKHIIQLTNIHRNKQNRLKTDIQSYKFTNIIAPMFKKVGMALQTDFMELHSNGKIDYKYWDDPNEIVDRLRLLIASQSAGHTGHNNEIISIIEELREANIIE